MMIRNCRYPFVLVYTTNNCDHLKHCPQSHYRCHRCHRCHCCHRRHRRHRHCLHRIVHLHHIRLHSRKNVQLCNLKVAKNSVLQLHRQEQEKSTIVQACDLPW